MKEPTRAPAYAVLYHGLQYVAREKGYSLAIHGSVLTDLDLVAIPWVEECCSAEALKDAIIERLGLISVNLDQYSKEHPEPEEKPHGRLAWKLHMDAGGSVDLSVMPRVTKEK